MDHQLKQKRIDKVAWTWAVIPLVQTVRERSSQAINTTKTAKKRANICLALRGRPHRDPAIDTLVNPRVL